MGIGDFFKKIFGGIRKILPFIKKALDNPVIRTILISKFGEKLIDLIRQLVGIADGLVDLSNEERHTYVRTKAWTAASSMDMSVSELDTHIKMAVAERRGEGQIVVA